MAERSRRRVTDEESGDEKVELSENSPTRERSSECESEGEHVEAEVEGSECESTNESKDLEGDEEVDGDDDEEEEEEEDEETEEEEDDEDEGENEEGEDVIVEGSEYSFVEEERQSGDGEEQPNDNAELDDDEDRKNPAYIPRKGIFYEHDMRIVGETAEQDKRPKKKLWQDEGHWHHDRYSEKEQAPKSREELIAMYGYDIRSHDKPPENLPNFNRRPRYPPSQRRAKFGEFIQDGDRPPRREDNIERRNRYRSGPFKDMERPFIKTEYQSEEASKSRQIDYEQKNEFDDNYRQSEKDQQEHSIPSNNGDNKQGHSNGGDNRIYANNQDYANNKGDIRDHHIEQHNQKGNHRDYSGLQRNTQGGSRQQNDYQERKQSRYSETPNSSRQYANSDNRGGSKESKFRPNDRYERTSPSNRLKNSLPPKNVENVSTKVEGKANQKKTPEREVMVIPRSLDDNKTMSGSSQQVNAAATSEKKSYSKDRRRYSGQTRHQNEVKNTVVEGFSQLNIEDGVTIKEAKQSHVSNKHQPSLPPRLQQQSERRKLQQQQQQQKHQGTAKLEKQDVLQQGRSKRYSSQRQRSGPEVGYQEQQQQIPMIPDGGASPFYNPAFPQGGFQVEKQGPEGTFQTPILPAHLPFPRIPVSTVAIANPPPPPPLSILGPPPRVNMSAAVPIMTQPSQFIGSGMIYAAPAAGAFPISSSHLIQASPLPVPQFPSPPTVPPPPTPALPSPMSQPQEVFRSRGGITYYSPELQLHRQTHHKSPLRRPNAAIPIVNPQDVRKDKTEKSGKMEPTFMTVQELEAKIDAHINEEEPNLAYLQENFQDTLKSSSVQDVYLDKSKLISAQGIYREREETLRYSASENGEKTYNDQMAGSANSDPSLDKIGDKQITSQEILEVAT